MAIPWRQMTAAAVAGDACLLLMLQVRSREVLVETFAILWLMQLVAWGIWHMYLYPHYASPLRHLPQPKDGHWLYGHRSGLHPGDIGVDARKWVNSIKHDNFIRYLDFFNSETLLVTSPRAISDILVSNNYNFPRSFVSRNLVGRYTGYGIGVAMGDEHKAQRRKLIPAFSLKVIRPLYPVFWAKGEETVMAMTAAAESSNSIIDIHSWALRCAIDVIGIASMGVDFGAVLDDNPPLPRAYEQLTAGSWQDGLLLLLEMVVSKETVSRLPLRRSREIDESLTLIHAACHGGIRITKKALEAGTLTRPNICSVGLEAGFSDELMVEQLTTALFGGQHAISKTLTAAVYSLSCFPEKQQRLRDELRSHLPQFYRSDSCHRPSYADIDGLPYLEAVVKEVLRKHGTGTSSREAKCDVIVQGVHIPRGTAIKLATHATSVDPELWGEDAAEFRPERWLVAAAAAANDDSGVANGAGRDAKIGGASSNYAFLPFMHGPQQCIAARFAQAEVACLLAAWFGRLEFGLADEALRDEGRLGRRPMESEMLVRVRAV
ncbi:hypothetical protein XA68_14063 [Ophiocordyceps unilateralis]|uniref:Cytochrome P450 n=1 Tax=Ophiocordyceps unilateralis TaxID=268505 RepID=A0A2A9PNF1_OPHUN|nr:hypothetical protein XA68_14063 [Ophiocordyceps unilateralis]